MLSDIYENDTEKGVRPKYVPILMVKILLLQQWYSLSDPKRETSETESCYGPGTAQKHVREAVMKGMNVTEFYGDGAFDTNDLFTLLHQIGAKPVIKIRKNASTDHYRGSKYRRRAVREYQNNGYKQWAEDNDYGMRWPGTEGIFSAVKRKFGENCVSRPPEGLEAEGYQRIWVYNYLNQGAKREVKSLN